MLNPVKDIAEAQSLVDCLKDPYTVSNLVPSVFDRYVRIFHPALLQGHSGSRTVQWQEIANFTQRKIHKLMQWHSISLLPRVTHDVAEAIVRAGGSVVHAPVTGNCPSSVSQHLYDILDSLTTDVDSCWFGVWSGTQSKLFNQQVHSVKTDYREWDIYKGPLVWLVKRFFESYEIVNIVWPSNREWFLATDIDLDSTYIGCNNKLCATLLDSKFLEAYEVTADDDITINSDSVNKMSFADPPYGAEIIVHRPTTYHLE